MFHSRSAPAQAKRLSPVPRIYWYGPKFGSGSTGDLVSHTYPVVAALQEKANAIAMEAKWLLDSRPAIRREHPGHSSEIGVKHHGTTDLDSVVFLKDTDDGDSNHGGAWAIEKRHNVLADAVDNV